MFRKRILFVLFSLLGSSLTAQLTISSPLNNAVYQRNASSQASLIINGLYTQEIVTSIQARLLNPDGNLPILGFDWTIIVKNPTKGTFSGQLNQVPAGWYILEVKAVRAGVSVASSSINRIGIGDVFMIAGQSNAQGWTGGNPVEATNPKVVTHDFNMYCRNEVIPFPLFQQIQSNSKTSIGGRDAWCYGKLGDNIVSTTGFPVAFFNGAASGSKVDNWTQSINGSATTHPFTLAQFCSLQEENGIRPENMPPQSAFFGMPYLNFKKGLNFYNSMFGARSVLWHQGESDNVTVTPTQTSLGYQTGLNTLINQSRNDFSANLPWVIARVSFINQSSDVVLTTAQTGMLNLPNQIFLGPETDDLNNNNPSYANSRDLDNVHFKNQGLIELANRWSNFLNPTFFTNSTPVIANTPPQVTTSFVNNTTILMSVPAIYSSYKWVAADGGGNFGFGNASVGNSNTLQKTSGTYRCWVTTANGNMQISAPVNVNQVINLGLNPMICSQNVFLSDLKYVNASNSQGPIELNKTNGANGDGDGSAIVLKGIPYSKGMGVSANSEITYNLPVGQFFRLRAKLGIGDEISNMCNNTGGVIFNVFGDGNLIYTSPTVFRNSALINLDVSILSYSSIKLTVEEVANSSICNLAIWADPVLLCVIADNEPPTAPNNLVLSDTLTKCLTFQWAASIDNLAVQGYKVYKDNVFLTTVAANVLNYTLSGLVGAQAVVFGVEAIDANNNSSTRTNLNASTVNIDVKYGVNDAVTYICTNQTYLPITRIPSTGIFSIVPGFGGTVNPTTGAFMGTTVNRQYSLSYTIGSGNPQCESAPSFVLSTTPPPTSPVITSDKIIINIGTPVNLVSSGCNLGILSWSFSNSSALNIQHSPNSTTTYRSVCQQSQCFVYSNPILVKVLPNCHSVITFTNPVDNLSTNINALSFNTSTQITASNQIVPSNNVTYQAAKSILLNPGFKINPGVIFTAKIQNCPN